MSHLKLVPGNDAAAAANNAPLAQSAATTILQFGGGGGNSDGMSTDHDIHGRLSRLEGGNTVLLGAVAIVSAVLIGGMAMVVGIQINSQQQAYAQYTNLNAKVDALPGEIRTEITEVIRTVSTAVSAGNSRPEPLVVILPPQNGQEATGPSGTQPAP